MTRANDGRPVGRVQRAVGPENSAFDDAVSGIPEFLRASFVPGQVCDHGSLKRSCDICERDAEIQRLRAELAIIADAKPSACFRAWAQNRARQALRHDGIPWADADVCLALDNLGAAAAGRPRPHDKLQPWPSHRRARGEPDKEKLR